MTVTFSVGTEIERGGLWALGVNRNQSLLGKIMIFLERPCTSVSEVTAEEWMELHDQIRRTREAIDSLFAPDQYNYAFLMNEDDEVHLHVLPRYKRARTWESTTIVDRNFGSLHEATTVELPADSLSRLAQAIRECLPERASNT
jgi:diadenosine tetraphosphate (Ap4A) HIT family hydrolase